MVGWLVINSFVTSPKFFELYDLLRRSAAAEGITLVVKPSSSLLCEIGNDFSEFFHAKDTRRTAVSGTRSSTSQKPDFVLFWDKDILLAQRLESAGIRVFNSARTISLCDDKMLTALALNAENAPAPKTVFIPKTFEGTGYSCLDFLDNALDRIKLPCVIKEANGSFGKQVFLARTKEEAAIIVRRSGCKRLLLQEFIKNSSGRDVRINVVGGRVVASILRQNPNDFRSNITNGGTMQRYTPTAEQAALAIRACAAVGADFAGVDVLFGENDTPLICEINSNPHFKSTLDCTGIDLSRFIIRHISARILS